MEQSTSRPSGRNESPSIHRSNPDYTAAQVLTPNGSGQVLQVLSGGPCEIYTELVETDAADAHARDVTAFLQKLGYRLVQVTEHRAPGTFPRVFDGLFVRS